MNKFHKAALCLTLALAISAGTVTALAATYATPAEAAAALSQKTTEEVQALRESGKSYGSIAADAGKLEEFQSAMLALREEALDARVASGQITQEQADAALTAVKEHQSACDGTGNGSGCTLGAGCGTGVGSGARNGHGMGHGNGRGHGRGNGGCRR